MLAQVAAAACELYGGTNSGGARRVIVVNFTVASAGRDE
jgi:hypothetical protein